MNADEQWMALAPSPRELSGDDEWNVFLSYRSVNRSWVLNLYDVLREHGHSVFLDQVSLKAGDQLTRRLEQGLTGSQAAILIWSSATADSDWVRREYEVIERQATSKEGFQFVPVRLDDAALPVFAANRVFLDFSRYPDGPNGGELLRLLHAVVGEPLTDEAARFANEQDNAARQAAVSIDAAILNGDAERLIALFDEGGLVWQTSAALGSKIADGLLAIGKRAEAIAILAELEASFPRAVRPRQLHALGLARRGEENDLAEAQTILGELYAAGERDPETLGIYGRTWMDRYEASGDTNHLRKSRDLYAAAFEGARDDYYTGINAAAKSVFMGGPEDLAAAEQYAGRVQEIVGEEPKPGDYWETATVGEVHLIKGDYSNAARLYEAAVAIAPEARDWHASTWKQACRLMEKLEPDAGDRATVRHAFRHLDDCPNQ
ncbi:MAG: toll/interleukin-1 receptor domain-containing protein [Actinomycetota bacterium]